MEVHTKRLSARRECSATQECRTNRQVPASQGPSEGRWPKRALAGSNAREVKLSTVTSPVGDLDDQPDNNDQGSADKTADAIATRGQQSSQTNNGLPRKWTSSSSSAEATTCTRHARRLFNRYDVHCETTRSAGVSGGERRTIMAADLLRLRAKPRCDTMTFHSSGRSIGVPSTGAMLASSAPGRVGCLSSAPRLEAKIP